MGQLGCHWEGFCGIGYSNIFKKYVEKIQTQLKSDKNDTHYTWRPIHIFLIISRSFLLIIRNISDNVIEKIKTHLMFKNFFFENREKKWKNMEEPDRAQLTIWRMRIACWIPKATNAHIGIYTRNKYSFSTESIDAWTRLSVTRCIHCLSCWLLATMSVRIKTSLIEQQCDSALCAVNWRQFARFQTYIRLVFFLTTDRKPLPQPAVYVVRSRASSFRRELDITHKTNSIIRVVTAESLHKCVTLILIIKFAYDVHTYNFKIWWLQHWSENARKAKFHHGYLFILIDIMHHLK
jgi:hypothetical protein